MIEDPKKFLQSVPNKPGVYQMYDGVHKILYVGKAKDLKKRLSSYFYAAKSIKTAAFMEQVKDIEIIITENENAALLLEGNLIKDLKPRYNILFKDDKSFPYLLLSNHEFPRLSIYRGIVNEKQGEFYGPFPSTKAVNFIFDLLQKIFHLRICNDSYLHNRSRPCLLYQIKLCSAPCAVCIDQHNYGEQVRLAQRFLCNKSDEIVQKITQLMDEAATGLNYEQAANYRDQIISIRSIQTQQAIVKNSGNMDVVALATNAHGICIDILFVRNGLLLGNKSYFPSLYKFDTSDEDIIATFLTQHYLQNESGSIIPDKILINVKLTNCANYNQLLSEKFQRKIIITNKIKGAQNNLLNMAKDNAENALKTHFASVMNYFERLNNFKQTFQLAFLPRRIECFDISHSSGEATIGSCIVFNENGPDKSAYRRYNIKNLQAAGDDYGAMHEVLMRRFGEFKDLPDVVIIDGGKGQLHIAMDVFKELNLLDKVFLMAVAKGRERRPGMEEIYVYGKHDPVVLSPDSPVLYFIQVIRDESHRFAISGNRKKIIKSRTQSILGNIAGIGKARQVFLLKHFGGLAELKSAGIDDLTKVKGISRDLAQKIYDYLHN